MSEPIVVRGDARRLPLPDGSVDLIVTSPPYFALRSYTDGGAHYAGQLGSEPTPAAYIAALVDCTREWVRVLKPSGSIFVNLGDKYSGVVDGRNNNGYGGGTIAATHSRPAYADREAARGRLATSRGGIPVKSLMLLPERYRVACVDQLGLIARAVIVWAKPNGLPESVTDRVRRSHEDWVHLTKAPRYYAAIDEIREPHIRPLTAEQMRRNSQGPNNSMIHGTARGRARDGLPPSEGGDFTGSNPLGKLPGSVWEVATEPLKIPERLGVDHFACVDEETEVLTRRGWQRHDSLRVDDEVAGCDLDSGGTRWTRVHGIHRYDYDGEMVVAEARGLSMRLTPNHRTIVHRYAGRHARRQAAEVIHADVLTAQHGIPRAVDWVEDGREKSIGVDLAALCGWVAAEGWVTEGGRVYLCQSASANPRKVDEIDHLLTRVEVPPADRAVRVKYRRSLDRLHRAESAREWQGQPHRMVIWGLPLGLSQQLCALLPGKMLPDSFGDLPLVEARALLDAFVDADGNRRADGRLWIGQKHRQCLDVLQMVAVRLGYNTTLTHLPGHPGGRWALHLNPPRPARLRRADGTSLVGREHYAGTVWCVTTGTGTFVARRNGKVFVTGNSFPSEWPRRLILGWSPPGICTACGEGRRPVTTGENVIRANRSDESQAFAAEASAHGRSGFTRDVRWMGERRTTITGYACACTPYTDHPGTGERDIPVPEHWQGGPISGGGFAKQARDRGPSTGPWREYHFDRWTPPPTRPAVVLDPFSGTGTVLHVASALGRIGIGVDLSWDYCMLAAAPELADQRRRKVLGLDKAPVQVFGQEALWA